MLAKYSYTYIDSIISEDPLIHGFYGIIPPSNEDPDVIYNPLIYNNFISFRTFGKIYPNIRHLSYNTSDLTPNT